MTSAAFRRLALNFPEAVESEHMNHPDFRVCGKIFATLAPDETWGMVKLTAEQQAVFLRTAAPAFVPASGSWGKRGSTIVRLAAADESTVRQAMTLAWRNIAPKRLAESYDAE